MQWHIFASDPHLKHAVDELGQLRTQYLSMSLPTIGEHKTSVASDKCSVPLRSFRFLKNFMRPNLGYARVAVSDMTCFGSGRGDILEELT